MADIFICYSSKDREKALLFQSYFMTQDWSVFMDTHIHAGHVFHAEIERELDAARAVVTLWSQHSIASEYVLDEAEEAKTRNILIPALIEDVRIPYGFRRRQTANLIDWTGASNHHDFENVFLPPLQHLLGTPTPQTATKSNPTPVPTHTKKTKPSLLMPGTSFEDKLTIGGTGPKMIVLPAGQFLMGKPEFEKGRENEIPQHSVTIARPFAMGVYPVTFDDYDCFCSETGQDKPGDRNWGRGLRPVINVSWEDAQLYCQWLTAQTGREYRLPNEAEWEYGARGGTSTRYWWGGEVGSNQMVCSGAGSQWDDKQTAPVGSFKANPYGLFDVHGNVWEWCEDPWHESYESAPIDGSVWSNSGDESRRVLRGGAWGDTAGFCRAAFRYWDDPGNRSSNIGFRVCCSSPIETLKTGD